MHSPPKAHRHDLQSVAGGHGIGRGKCSRVIRAQNVYRPPRLPDRPPRCKGEPREVVQECLPEWGIPSVRGYPCFFYAGYKSKSDNDCGGQLVDGLDVIGRVDRVCHAFDSSSSNRGT